MASSVMRRSSHTHNQDTAAAVWTISHGMYCRPAVTVAINYGGKLQVVIPKEVQIVDLNTVKITFSNPQSGVARLG